MKNNAMQKPIKRSALRSKLGLIYYSFLRHLLWLTMNRQFAKTRQSSHLPFVYFTHKTPLFRKLKDVDMWMQHNKVTNLRLASAKVSGILLRPGEVFSYWKLIGKPSRRKGYLDGMVLKSGTFHAGCGGGLCQLSNLIFWMTIHTPLTVTERHRHSYDVFPDSNRTQPFGSGATCFYPHGDLMIRNNTSDTYQLSIWMDDTYLHGQWRVSSSPEYRYEIIERNHEMRSEFWGGYSRHNELYQQKYDLADNLLKEQLIVQNSAIMMYEPFISEKTVK
ncbi:MAG: VanW family protein [Lachnospiraceae bacterium]|nr:VanW family protein [Lachnospiraceae bacterium]